MKTLYVLSFLLLTCLNIYSQQLGPKELIDEGIKLHDKGDYEGALNKYNQALAIENDNLTALGEKALTLNALQRYEESIQIAQQAIKQHPEERELRSIYVTLGNTYDQTQQPEKALATYEEGLKVFPDFYQLYFNKGITLSTLKRYDEAIICFQNDISYNPRHASGHFVLTKLLNYQKKRIPALLASCRFLLLEPESKRSEDALTIVREIMKGNAEKTGKKSISISVTPDMLEDTTATGEKKENNFSSTDLLLALSAGLDFEKKNKNKTEVERFKEKLELVIASLDETAKDNHGFYWDYYVPYFVSMKNKQLVETFSYVAFVSSGDAAVVKWDKTHEHEIDALYDWSKEFQWYKP